MASVTFYIHNQEYTLACDDGQENELRAIAERFSARVEHYATLTGNTAPHELLLVMTALSMEDKVQDAERIVQEQSMGRDLSLEQSALAQMQENVAATLDDIAARIEKVAHALEEA